MYKNPEELAKAVERSARIRGDFGRNLLGLAAVAARLGVYLLLCAAVLAAAAYGAREVYAMLTPREISVCVATDAAFRSDREDWAERVTGWFAQANEAFRPGAVQWRWLEGVDAYPPETHGDLRQRQYAMEQLAMCKTDVLIGFTGAKEAETGASIAPFGHSGMIAIGKTDSDLVAGVAVVRALATLFGVPEWADLQGPVLDAASSQLVRTLRRYDFSNGVAALPGKWERRASKALAMALRGKSPNPEAESHRTLARAFSAGWRSADAAAHWRQAAVGIPNDFSLRLELALALKAEGKVDDAIQETKQAAANHPKEAAPHALLGVLLRDRGLTIEAIEEFRLASALEPDNATYLSALGELLRKHPGRTAEAEQAVARALELNPDDGKARGRLDEIVRAKQVTGERLAKAQAALRANPHSGEARFDLAYAQARAGRVDEAIASLSEALAGDPSNGKAHIAMATLYYDRGQYQQARAELQLAEASGAIVPQSLMSAIHSKLDAVK